ncbi:LytTR family transcriptional regulator [Octadecabacter sp. G9-8]|uniref:LytTR family transcriptional regulator n=1 Tax=Octadecabacter dasysiphoniae TaxID=2909341 RepID=A0ABS9CRF4_9RHOB|nr:LytTR family DNA-binding domain-containing protein [Octadecabacter dasysiphoniae]MCF2869773.1 LytTR family transcriptional regulator [Octadecabacter dasysiphoniae]
MAGRSELLEDLAVALSLSVIFGPLVVLLNRIVGGAEAYQAMGMFAAMGCTFLIAIGTIALRRVLREPAKTIQEQAQVKRDRLLTRISAQPDARLARISSDNHHIRIVTDDGEEHRILMRLSDAVNETDVEPGVCVHRSHWVARAKVAGVKKVDGRDVVQLTCGGTLPVGPKYRDNLSFADDLSA